MPRSYDFYIEIRSRVMARDKSNINGTGAKQLETDKTQQALLSEALNDLFKKYGKQTIA